MLSLYHPVKHAVVSAYWYFFGQRKGTNVTSGSALEGGCDANDSLRRRRHNGGINEVLVG